MSFSAAERLANERSVGMGQAVVARGPTRLTAILGSCVAIALYSPKLRLGALGHVVLPRSNGGTAYPAKFADTAVPHMLSELKEQGVPPGALVAKIVGGACMFGSNSRLMDVGEANTQAAVEALDAANIQVTARDVAGTAGRRICLDLATGCLSISSPGHPPRTI